ncbi:peptidase M50 [Chloroflexales bacterium ZM16-3]|nr:peptidase M50 [Chloroflexales bacterium ZM16-3]
MFSTPSEDVFSRGTNDNIELLKAWAGSSIAFAIVQTGPSNLLSLSLIQNLIISAIVCGMAFVLHELAHRVVARNYGAEAHFIANDQWLLLSIVIAFAGFFIAAPGAVWHRGQLTLRQGGLIALAGPVTNLVLSILFLLSLCAIVLIGLPLPNLLLITLFIGFKFNAWIGVFNMIPAGPFDGAKVLAWNWQVFAVTVAVGVGLAFLLGDQVVLSLLSTLARLR